MNKDADHREAATDELSAIIRQRAFNLMSSRRMMCSEAVLSSSASVPPVAGF